MSGTTPIVDVHCHLFTAADTPVRCPLVHGEALMGRNVLRFLGLARESDPNGERLRRRYVDPGAARPARLAPPEPRAEP
jgi:hypothetical protein